MSEALQERMTHAYIPGKSGRTLVLFHGTGGDETSLLRFAPSLDPDASVLSLRGKSLDEGYPRFFRRMAEGVFDLDDLQAKSAEIAAFLADAYLIYGIDPKQTVAFGYSNGANAAAALWLMHPTAIQDAIFARPMVPIEPQFPPELTGKRGLILAGDRDHMCPIHEARRLHDMFVDFGAHMDFVAQACGHELIQEDFHDASNWLIGALD